MLNSRLKLNQDVFLEDVEKKSPRDGFGEALVEVAQKLRTSLKELIERGASRVGQKAANDTLVRFDTTQMKRWGPARE